MKTIMQMTDEILEGALSRDPDTSTNDPTSGELPEISDKDRTTLLTESMSESGPIPVDPAARAQHTAQGMSKNTLGRKKPTKTMGTPPGFEKTPEEKAAAKKAENASLYPLITLKNEYDATQRGNAIRARKKPRTSPVPPEQAAAGQARHDQRKADQKAHMAAANQRNREARARRRTLGSKSGPVKPDPATPGTAGAENSGIIRPLLPLIIEKKKDDDWIQGAQDDIERRGTEGKCTPITKKGCTGKAKALALTFKKMGKEKKAENSSITRKQYAILKEALTILREMTTVGGIGGSGSMAGSANKAYDADAKPMGKDTPPIKGVDSAIKKMNRKGNTKKASKKDKKKGSKNKEAENASFSRFLDTVIRETIEK